MKNDTIRDNPLPQLYLEQSLLGEAPDSIAERLAADPATPAKLAALEAENAEFLQRYPPRVMTGRIQHRRQRPTPRHFKLFLALGTALPALFVAAFFTIPAVSRGPGDEALALETTTTKGMDQAILVFLQGKSGYQEIRSGSTVKSYDSVQLAYRPGSSVYGLVFSLDGNMRLTLHHPESFNAPAVLGGTAQTLLPYAYQLDDAPNFERFYLAGSKESFDLQALWKDLERQAASQKPAAGTIPALRFPAGFQVSTFDVRKAGGSE